MSEGGSSREGEGGGGRNKETLALSLNKEAIRTYMFLRFEANTRILQLN